MARQLSGEGRASSSTSSASRSYCEGEQRWCTSWSVMPRMAYLAAAHNSAPCHAVHDTGYTDCKGNGKGDNGGSPRQPCAKQGSVLALSTALDGIASLADGRRQQDSSCNAHSTVSLKVV